MSNMQGFVKSKSGPLQQNPFQQPRDLTAPLTEADRRYMDTLHLRVNTNSRQAPFAQKPEHMITEVKTHPQIHHIPVSEGDPSSPASEDLDEFEETPSDLDMMNDLEVKIQCDNQPSHTWQQPKSSSKADMRDRLMGRPATPKSYPTTTASISQTSSHDGRSEKHKGRSAALPDHHPRDLGDQRDQEHSHSDREHWSIQSAGEQSNIADESMPPVTNENRPLSISINRKHPSKHTNAFPAYAPKVLPGLSHMSPLRPAFQYSKPGERISSTSVGPSSTSNPNGIEPQHHPTQPIQQHVLEQSPAGTSMEIGDGGKSLRPTQDTRHNGPDGRQIQHSQSTSPPARLLGALKRDSGSAFSTNPEKNRKISGLIETSDPEEGSSPESDTGLDYPRHELINKDFAGLQSETFDRSAMSRETQFAFAGSEEELRARLEEALRSKDQNAQISLLQSLDISHWEQAGSWFVEKQAEFFEKVVNIRKEKRSIALKYEGLIRERHNVVTDRSDLIRSQKEALKMAGVALLNAGTPKKRKAPGTPRMGPPPARAIIGTETGKVPNMVTKADSKAGTANAANAETSIGSPPTGEEQEKSGTNNRAKYQDEKSTSVPPDGKEVESQPPEA
ncbi:hypothetical protein KVT40_002017 [Elsinoe batatas]|uniref:Extracellular mutant protein 11 C-terminal domain-containing protein n=1 Tax=Elsinoe batatas TaxID=2601811 RepID=A0A8K0LDU7_9PEZI|nr:hypothetical protein KVT40_002017 [Elsinoe batatas]